jgi:hypothetical protein
LVVVVVVVLVVLLPLFFGAEAVFDFAAVEVLALFADFAAPPADLAPAEDFFLPLPSPSSKSPTASAATFNAVSAAPVAAPTKISPAASLIVSITGDSCFLVDFFAPDFDFVAAEVFAEDLDFAGAALFVVDFAEVAAFAVDFDFAGVELFAVVF